MLKKHIDQVRYQPIIEFDKVPIQIKAKMIETN